MQISSSWPRTLHSLLLHRRSRRGCTILSTWLARHEATGAVVPHHFIRPQVIDWDQPEVIASSLAAQIEAVFP